MSNDLAGRGRQTRLAHRSRCLAPPAASIETGKHCHNIYRYRTHEPERAPDTFRMHNDFAQPCGDRSWC